MTLPDDKTCNSRHSAHPHWWDHTALWLSATLVMGLLTGARWPVPLAFWIGPFCSLRLVDRNRGRWGFVLLGGVTVVSFLVGNRGVIPLPGAQLAFAAGAVWIVSYVLIRWHLFAVDRLASGWGTFALPCAVVTLEYLSSLGMFGTWSSSATYQMDQLGLAQLCSVTGLWGIAFLTAWAPAVGHWICFREPTWLHRGQWAGACGSTVLAVLMAGQLRLALAGWPVEVVTVAAVAPAESVFALPAVGEYLTALGQSGASETQAAAFQSALEQRERELFQWSRASAAAGARWIYWSEVATCRGEDTIASLDARAARFADEQDVYLAVGVGVWAEGTGGFRNQIRLFGPTGELIDSYLKHHVVPGEPSIAGPGQIRVLPLDDLRVAHVICFDTDFPAYIRQAGLGEADVLFAPSNDWPAAAEPHLAVATARALENGLTLVRATSQGISAVVDPYGRVVARRNSFTAGGGALLATIPARRIPTLYAQLGNWAAWLSMAGLLALVLASLLRARWGGQTGHRGRTLS